MNESAELPDHAIIALLKREHLLTRAKLNALYFEHVTGERRLRSLKTQLRQVGLLYCCIATISTLILCMADALSVYRYGCASRLAVLVGMQLLCQAAMYLQQPQAASSNVLFTAVLLERASDLDGVLCTIVSFKHLLTQTDPCVTAWARAPSCEGLPMMHSHLP